jgi:hypothetical protein
MLMFERRGRLRKDLAMTTAQYVIGVSTLIYIGVTVSASAATERMRPGQWVGTTIVGGKTYPTSSCVSQRDATQMNGDAKAVQAYVETIIPPEICTISNVSAEGARVVYMDVSSPET